MITCQEVTTESSSKAFKRQDFASLASSDLFSLCLGLGGARKQVGGEGGVEDRPVVHLPVALNPKLRGGTKLGIGRQLKGSLLAALYHLNPKTEY